MPDFPKVPNAKLSDPNSEEYWMAREDANTLKRAALIESDPERSKGARYMLEQEEAERQSALARLDD